MSTSDPNLQRSEEQQRDEHAVVGGMAGKKVFVLDNAGNQITSFGAAAQATITPVGLVTLAPSSNFIGIVTVANKDRTIVGNLTLSDPKGFIGIVTAVAVDVSFSYANYASNTTATPKSGAGVLHTFVINTKGTGSTAILYDSLLPSGIKIATVDTTLSTTAFVYDVSFTTGLTLAMAGAGAADLTVSYR